MKKIIIALAIAIICISTLGVFKDQIIKTVVTVAATQLTGAPVHIDGFALGIFRQVVRISGFKIYNPKGFSKSLLVDLPKINVTYDLGALFKKKLHLINTEIELKEMGLEKNKEGELNVDALTLVKQGKKQSAKPSAQMPMQFDTLQLGIGRIVLKDYSSGKTPVVKVYDINIHKSYRNISSAQQLAGLILAEPMKEAGIQGVKIYGVAMLAGAAVLPVAVATTFAGRDSVEQEFLTNPENVFEASLTVLKGMGKITREDKSSGVIDAEVNSASVAVKITKKEGNKTKIVISARKYLLPKPEIAGGILYEVSEELK